MSNLNLFLKPMLKWVGGKRQLLSEIMPLILDINKKENNISVYGDFICRFKTHRIVNSEKEVEILINEKRKNEIFLMV